MFQVPHFFRNKKRWSSGQRVLTFNFDDPSSNSAEAYSFLQLNLCLK